MTVGISIMILILCIYLKENQNGICQFTVIFKRCLQQESPCFRELFHYLRKPIYFCILDMFQIVGPIETFFSGGWPAQLRSSVRFISIYIYICIYIYLTLYIYIENICIFSPAEKPVAWQNLKSDLFFWQQMAVFSGTIAMYLLATRESHTTFLSPTSPSCFLTSLIRS